MKKLVINFTKIKSKRLNFLPAWKLKKTDWFQSANDLELAVAMGEKFPFPYTKKDAKEFLQYSQTSFEDEHEFNFAILVKNTSTVMGFIGFRPSLDKNLIENIGYWLGPQYRGNGYATEALLTMIDFIWATLPKVKSIHASCKDYNFQSKSVLRKAGFIFTGETTETQLLRNNLRAANEKFYLQRPI
jgi:RimJ/RimL family protein N-acetyltransferase